MKRYPKYKDSGAPWLGQVPAHWEVKRLRHLGALTSSGIDKISKEGEQAVSMINFVDVFNSKTKRLKKGDFELMTTTAPADKASIHQVRRGDILITPSSEESSDIGRSALVDDDFSNTVYSYHLLRFSCTSRNVSPYFLSHVLNSTAALSQLSAVAQGTTRQTLSRGDIKDVCVGLPGIEEQLKIAAFLDQSISSFNHAISSQERMIELLKERRSAIITQAVTKGLDPKAKMKDSGVSWLGQVPAHWNVKRLKRVFSEINEKARAGDEQLAATQKYGVISQSQFMKAEDQKLVLALKGTDNFKHVDQDDFVISLRAFEGGIERSIQSGCVSPAYTVLRSGGELSSAYSARLLKTPSFISQISMTYDGIREGKAIKFKDVAPVFLPIPPAKEQAAIVSYIGNAIGQMDAAISSQERMIELLKERRSAIVTQAVTGQIDVR